MPCWTPPNGGRSTLPSTANPRRKRRPHSRSCSLGSRAWAAIWAASATALPALKRSGSVYSAPVISLGGCSWLPSSLLPQPDRDLCNGQGTCGVGETKKRESRFKTSNKDGSMRSPVVITRCSGGVSCPKARTLDIQPQPAKQFDRVIQAKASGVFHAPGCRARARPSSVVVAPGGLFLTASGYPL